MDTSVPNIPDGTTLDDIRHLVVGHSQDPRQERQHVRLKAHFAVNLNTLSHLLECRVFGPAGEWLLVEVQLNINHVA